ncbi:MAG: hypothetical protein PHS62_04540 [Patescibacteria group bacterium]|nr:hypothetical protein [Patescibacteria group bacterium]
MQKIKYFLSFIKDLVKSHKLAVICALVVGMIYLAPYLFFIASLGGDYKGIPMMSTANEDAYLLRMQEIMDGHYLIGSPVYFEYKNEWPMMPPAGEMFYALPSLIFNISIINVLMASRFILPLILFLLVYFLIFELSLNKNYLSSKINAIAGSLFVILGYDLVDYRTLWLLLTGKIGFGAKFLLWARPVNPILGAIFLFSFLLCLWFIIKNGKFKKTLIILAGAFLSLMIGSYFFSWGLALSVLAILVFTYLLKKEYRIVKNLLLIILTTVLATLPFWFMSFQASKSPWYKLSVLRNGLFYTHQLMFNKVLLAALFFYFLLSIPALLRKIKLVLKDRALFRGQFNLLILKDWQIFCLSLLLGGLWALNQQAVTGMTIWPYHFVQYTIPFSIVTAMVLIYNIIYIKNKYVWGLIITIVIASSLVFGIGTQAGAYRKSYDFFAGQQKYKQVFNWLNQQKKDCVVLVKEPEHAWYELNDLISGFTHCNIYASEQTYSLMPYERSHFNYLVNLRLKGVSAENIEEYMKENEVEVATYLFSNWRGVYNLADFPDFPDLLLAERIKKFPQDYREFLKKNFGQELRKYQIDYILSVDPLTSELSSQLGGVRQEFNSGNVFIYALKK